MPKYRLKAALFDSAVYDGNAVGIFDPVFGAVVSRTSPKWFPPAVEEVETLKMLEVRDGHFIVVRDHGLFFGQGSAWRKVEAGDRILCSEDGQISVVGPEALAMDFEPA